jgi:hypothetical protein
MAHRAATIRLTDPPAVNGQPGAAPIVLGGLAELIEAAVQRAAFDIVGKLRADMFPVRLAFGEARAARMIGLREHQLRDARRRGEIRGVRGPRGKPLYRLEDLAKYLEERLD